MYLLVDNKDDVATKDFEEVLNGYQRHNSFGIQDVEKIAKNRFNEYKKNLFKPRTKPKPVKGFSVFNRKSKSKKTSSSSSSPVGKTADFNKRFKSNTKLTKKQERNIERQLARERTESDRKKINFVISACLVALMMFIAGNFFTKITQ